MAREIARGIARETAQLLGQGRPEPAPSVRGASGKVYQEVSAEAMLGMVKGH